MIVITVPLLFPVLASYNIDPLLFGRDPRHLYRARADIAPIGINLFVIQSIWNGKLLEVILGTICHSNLMHVRRPGAGHYWPEFRSGCRSQMFEMTGLHISGTVARRLAHGKSSGTVMTIMPRLSIRQPSTVNG